VASLQDPKVEISQWLSIEKGIAEGETIEIYNDRGSFQGKAKVVSNTHPKTICVHEGRWNDYGGIINNLTPNTISDVGLGSTLYDCLVGLRKIT
jgi:anaerobic selenocysteine-containing dehydrogenase